MGHCRSQPHGDFNCFNSICLLYHSNVALKQCTAVSMTFSRHTIFLGVIGLHWIWGDGLGVYAPPRDYWKILKSHYDLFLHSVSLRINLNIDSTKLAGVESAHFSNSSTTHVCNESNSLKIHENTLAGHSFCKKKISKFYHIPAMFTS